MTPFMDTCATWTQSDWTLFVKRRVIDCACGTLIGRPSRELANRVVEEEKERVKRQREGLGEKLKELEERLKEMKRVNEEPFPVELMGANGKNGRME